MEINKIEKLLFLLLLNKVRGWNNDFELIRILQFKFKIFYFLDLRNSLISDGLITCEEKNQLGYYFTTDNGIEFLKENILGLHERIIARYPEQVDFLESIFKMDDIVPL